MMSVTLLLVSLTAALPSVFMEAQREREAELIFRGNEYARAIALFHTRFSRYPSSVDELVKKTNGIRFLRRKYRDPMSKNGKWRFIHVSAAGVLLDSKSMKVQAGMVPGGANSPLGGNASGTAGFGQTGSSGSIFGGTTGGGSTGVGQTGPGQTGPGQTASTNRPGASNDQTQSDEGSPAQPEGSQSEEGTQTQSGLSSANQTLGAFIAGVASRSKKRSIRILTGKTRYDDWEFIGIGMSAGGTQVIAPGGSNPPGGFSGPGGPGDSGSSILPPQATPQPPAAEPSPPSSQPEPQPPDIPSEGEPPGDAEPQQ